MRTLPAFELREDVIQIWSSPVKTSESSWASLQAVLSEEEAERASRTRPGSPRETFVAVRGALRHLLGRYLKCSPGDIHFIYGPHGKPRLASVENIHFSLTHSGERVAFAFATGGSLGIDMERIRMFPAMKKIASRMFCADEEAEIMQLPESEQERAFFRCWTRKEAYAKATGEGLLAAFDSYRVTVRPNQPAEFLHFGNDAKLAGTWSLHDLFELPDYAAALAYPGDRRSISTFQLASLDEVVAM